jgi:hypothetical protein
VPLLVHGVEVADQQVRAEGFGYGVFAFAGPPPG